MTATPQATSLTPSVPGSLQRVRTAGKFLAEANGRDWWLNGVSYGPFPPNAAGEPYPEAARIDTDFRLIRGLGFNAIRLYEPPSPALLAAAATHQLRLLVTLPWTDHVDFLSAADQRRQIRDAVSSQVRRLAAEPTVAAILIGNEIDKGLVRWMGPRRVQRFLEGLLADVRRLAPGVLCGYATYPSTEYLMPRTADFFAVNLYLEDPQALAAYLRRLQNLAGNKPLLVTEFGLDVKRHGVEKQAEVMRWQRHLLLESGVAGNVWFAFTDEWQRGGRLVSGWQFGLVDAGRQPRPACAMAAALPRRLEPLPESPAFSVIVCTRNGSVTLRACLDSLTKLRYPNYEVLVIDDGSTDSVPDILKDFPTVRSVRQDPAGLSVARNRGMNEARGPLLAFTDDDCLAHPDWLLHLSRAFAESPEVVAAGGPNIPPPPRNRTEAVVAAAPGAPAHVLLNDAEAEHLPGCNLAIRKEALERLGGFQPVFTAAGDDVDVCWRLRAAGGVLRFVPGAMVWHHRRFSISAYLKQQRGYGRAEALLMKAHPGHFGLLGGARWRGCIYGTVLPTDDPAEGSVYFGPFGDGLFQGIYRQASGYLVEWASGVLWPALAALALALHQPVAALAVVAVALGVAVIRRRHLPASPFALGWWQELQLQALCLLQPLVRESARLAGMLKLGARPAGRTALPEVALPPPPPQKWSLPVATLAFWSESGADRHLWLPAFQVELQNRQLSARRDDGWRRFDFEVHSKEELSAAVLTLTEYHGGGRCLTRVRLLLRFTSGLVVALALVVGLEVALALSDRPLWQTTGRVSLALTAAMAILAPRFLLRPLRRAALSAAARVGLALISKRRIVPDVPVQ